MHYYSIILNKLSNSSLQNNLSQLHPVLLPFSKFKLPCSTNVMKRERKKRGKKKKKRSHVQRTSSSTTLTTIYSSPFIILKVRSSHYL